MSDERSVVWKRSPAPSVRWNVSRGPTDAQALILVHRRVDIASLVLRGVREAGLVRQASRRESVLASFARLGEEQGVFFLSKRYISSQIDAGPPPRLGVRHWEPETRIAASLYCYSFFPFKT